MRHGLHYIGTLTAKVMDVGVEMEIHMQLMKFPSHDLSGQSMNAKSQVLSYLKK
jgi:hypothetical protein